MIAILVEVEMLVLLVTLLLVVAWVVGALTVDGNCEKTRHRSCSNRNLQCRRARVVRERRRMRGDGGQLACECGVDGGQRGGTWWGD